MELVWNTVYKLGVLGLVLFLVSCDPEIDDAALSNRFEIDGGDQNTENIVFYGDEWMAGFQNNELYFSGQFNAFPSILSQQFGLVRDQQFSFPAMYDEEGLGNRLRLSYVQDCNGDTSLIPAVENNAIDARNNENLANDPYNNMGVPGLSLRVIDNEDYAEENPYWARMKPASASTVMEAMGNTDPSFALVWLGLNDVLQWAKTGGSPFTSDFIVPTPDFIFEENLRELLDTIDLPGAGMIATLPRFVDFPFFEIIPRDALVLNEEQARQLNLIYILNPNVSFSEGENFFVVQDGLFARQIRANERILLTTNLDSIRCENYGSVYPLSNSDVLLADEIAQIEEIRNRYNSIIRQVAAEKNWKVVDIQPFFNALQNEGINWDGVNTGFTFVTGGFFSLDGIHPTPRGAALLANEFLSAYNQSFGASLPMVNPNDYNGVSLP